MSASTSGALLPGVPALFAPLSSSHRRPFDATSGQQPLTLPSLLMPTTTLSDAT